MIEVSELTSTRPSAAETASRLTDEMYELHARFCRGLSDPKRLLIIAALRGRERTVSQLASAAGARQANISQHLALMRHLGLVQARRVDNNVYYSLTDPRIGEAIDLLRAVQADLQRRQSVSLRIVGAPSFATANEQDPTA